jgi:hypothetical protein
MICIEMEDLFGQAMPNAEKAGDTYLLAGMVIGDVLFHAHAVAVVPTGCGCDFIAVDGSRQDIVDAAYKVNYGAKLVPVKYIGKEWIILIAPQV